MTPLGGQGARLGVVEVDVASGITAVSLGRSTERGIRVMSEHGVRRLTPTECERLLGFPDGWTAIDGADEQAQLFALGNSMAVPVVRWIGQRIADVELVDPQP